MLTAFRLSSARNPPAPLKFNDRLQRRNRRTVRQKLTALLGEFRFAPLAEVIAGLPTPRLTTQPGTAGRMPACR